MAKTIATITGTALLPGVSANKRWYKPEHVAEAVRAAQERIRSGSKPMVMLTFHGADDNSREIAASLTDVSLNENGGMDFAAGFTDTDAGWNIARLADTTDGKPAHLKTVSIRGAWTGRVRKERGPAGEVVETADGVTVDGIDFTRSPGVAGAEIKTFDWVKDGASETAERVLITESVQEARVTITEDAPPAPDGVREALRSVFGDAVAEAGTPAMSKRGSGLSDEKGRVYADPGYQQDKKQRYDISNAKVAKAAWAYINQPDNAKLYTPNQLKRVKGRIKAALGKFGVTVAAEGWSVDPAVELTEALLEYYGGDPSCAGSYSLSATNGPTTVTVCSYGCDPADLMVILQQACKGAGIALKTLDPDMDADIDLPGEQESATDGDLAEAGLAPPLKFSDVAAARPPEPAVTEAAQQDPAASLAAADRQGTEDPAVSETTTTETAATAPASLTQADIDDAVSRALAADRAARKARKAAKGKPAETAPAETVAETTAPQAPAGPDIEKLVKEGVAAALAAEGLTETVEQKVERLVKEGVTAAKQELTAAGGGPGRKGLVTEHSAARAGGTDSLPEGFPMKDGRITPMEQWTDDERRAAGKALQDYVMGDRAVY